MTATVNVDVAKAMGNGMYSILLGLAIRGILVDPHLQVWPVTLVALYIALLAYYVLDWLTYNARIQLPKPMSHEELAGNVVSILVFGSSLNFSLRLLGTDGKLAADPDWFVNVFQGFFFLYLLLTTIGLLRIAKTDPFTSSSWETFNLVLRGFVCGIALMLILWCMPSVSKVSPSAVTLLFIYALLTLILVASKAIRYTKLFLAPVPQATPTPTPATPPEGAQV